jgi:hypothetical protein
LHGVYRPERCRNEFGMTKILKKQVMLITMT